MSSGHAIEVLRNALRCLPGVGPKTAQRMAFHLLERDREGGRAIVTALQQALDGVMKCQRCNNFSESTLCDICSASSRDAALLCVVENPADLEAIEQAGVYSGMYFVLMGQLAPLDGVGPEELGLDKLQNLLAKGEVCELILATNLTLEGEATAHFLTQLVEAQALKISRLARGLPVGGELEYMDHGTLEQAFGGRTSVE